MNGNMIGRVFNNRYQLKERIGVGGMAEVYLGQDNVLSRLVAVKVMLPQYAADPEFTKRFRQEAAAAANLQSPYIVNVYDWGQDDGIYYIVMEYVRGSDLKTAIQQRGPINQRKVAEIGAQVCQALSVAHNQDIMHRDIKPQNIMVQPDGNVKVMDFGIARAKNSVAQHTSAVLGTAHYISPEQAQGKEVTQASDIYSLGIVLYEAACGKLPFDGPDAVSVATMQVNEYPAPPSQVNPDIDPSLEAIIMKALEKNPYDRFATAGDMKRSLNDYLAGRVVGFGADNEQTRVMGFVPGVGTGAGTGTQVMTPVQTGTATSSTRTMVAEDTKSKGSGNGKKIAIVAAIIVAIAAIAIAMFTCTGTASGTIPDVTGKTLEQATTILENAGYKIGTQTSVYSDDIASGSIVSTDPVAGTEAAQGTTVNLTVSKGKEEIDVPDLTGMTEGDAKAALASRGFTAQKGDDKSSSDVAEGSVCEQSPAANTKAEKGATITYHLSSGPETVEVPNVVGMSRGNAKAALENAGFVVIDDDYDYSDKYDEGVVMYQSESAGAQLEKGSSVSITTSLGEEPKVTIPSVVGETQSDAISALQSAGFSYTVQEQSSSSVAKGTVISQSPTGTAASGTTVTIVVSKGPESSSGSTNNSSSSS